ncbi:hypothetical protein EDB81DRAFT_880845 [Dactylonectria macrodidyma]|uniref:HTH araC/xylS-type domain-containing protein n=1 Tax=Dactylonectria macrodidyma TaxID=307937 RepID=A0A9P9FA09_9HYPO|nr:hypothetical protein EDB81DRAFT_880845 [Dactylonectria macrodidyma]
MDISTPNLKSPIPFISLFDNDESRWQAVVSRNANADGFFVYGVKTTKIFCRPICKARLARRANVSFYLSGKEAQQYGFRACKRCKPELAGFMPEEMAVQKIRSFVDKRACGRGETGEARLSLSQMAKQTGLSKWHFYRVFKKCVGMTPTEYLRNERTRHETEDQQPDDQALWMQGLDIENFASGFGFPYWDDAITGSGQSMTDASSTAVSECSPWNMDDLVTWPDESVQGPA